MKKTKMTWKFLEIVVMATVMTIAYYIFTNVFTDALSNTFATLLVISVFVLWLYFTMTFRK